MQFTGQGKPPLGVVYITTMRRADSALALAALHSLEGLREARIAAVGVHGSGLAAAVFCDVVSRFYNTGPLAPNSNRLLPVGFQITDQLPADPPMALVARSYVTGVRRAVDTSEITAQFRNSLTYIQDNNVAVVLSASAEPILQSLKLPGTAPLVKSKVKLLVIVDNGEPPDPALLAQWPSPVVIVPKSLGEALPYPGASIEKDFAWSQQHPVVDAYKAYRPMPYDAPSYDLAAMLYAVRPESGLFTVKDGVLTFDPAKKDDITKAFVDLVSAKPVVRRPFRPPPVAVAK